MNTIHQITKSAFFKKYRVKEIDLVNVGLFTQKDILELKNYQNTLTLRQKMFILPSYLLFALKNPKFFSAFILSKAGFGKKEAQTNRELQLKDINPIKNCILKSSIAAAFKPALILEVGTYLGWGAASFKKACPNALVYTINPKENLKANNPIHMKKVGYFYRKKKLKINQIWADSTAFNFKSIPNPDVVYIDGNHAYDFVYKDLENSAAIVKKCIILDDFVPPNSKQLYCPWNESVVKATKDFLTKNNKLFKEAFWIKDTPLCILIKNI